MRCDGRLRLPSEMIKDCTPDAAGLGRPHTWPTEDGGVGQIMAAYLQRATMQGEKGGQGCWFMCEGV